MLLHTININLKKRTVTTKIFLSEYELIGEDLPKPVTSAVDGVLTLRTFYEVMDEFKNDVFKPP